MPSCGNIQSVVTHFTVVIFVSWRIAEHTSQLALFCAASSHYRVD
jgi:hypothetical protein